MDEYLSPRQLAEAIGVSESSIKRWADEGLIDASRTAGGHRRIPVHEAVRFIRESNVPVARPDLLGFPEVGLLAHELRTRGETTEALYQALLDGDGPRAFALIHAPFLAGRSLAEVFDGPVRDAMRRLGELWRHREDGIFLEHRATDICLQALMRLRVAVRPPGPDAPSAVGAAAAGDPYLLPTLMCAIILSDTGFAATNLGPQTPLSSLRLAAGEHGARLVWLSVSVEPAAQAIRPDLTAFADELARRETNLIVGGRERSPLAALRHPNLVQGDTMGELAAFGRGLLASGGS